jgi:hypothetical protein
LAPRIIRGRTPELIYGLVLQVASVILKSLRNPLKEASKLWCASVEILGCEFGGIG